MSGTHKTATYPRWFSWPTINASVNDPVSDQGALPDNIPDHGERCKHVVVPSLHISKALVAVNKAFPFAIVLRRIRKHVKSSGVADAAMFELRERGYTSVFQQLVACILSIRTRDEVSLPAAITLFEHSSTPAAIVALGIAKLDSLIRTSSFHEAKARQIYAIAERTVTDYNGELPCDTDVLMQFNGVGPKCANLALGVACGHTGISVDIHVHRVTNRWGAVATSNPAATMRALEQVLPKRYWIEINRLLVPFGKHVCTGTLPKCSTCPVLEYCAQVGVTKHR